MRLGPTISKEKKGLAKGRPQKPFSMLSEPRLFCGFSNVRASCSQTATDLLLMDLKRVSIGHIELIFQNQHLGSLWKGHSSE